MIMSNLYERQQRLREIGVTGQAKLQSASVRLASGPGAEVARDYLCRAGLGSVSIEGDAPASFPHEAYFQSEVCLDFALGAWVATRQVVEILELK